MSEASSAFEALALVARPGMSLRRDTQIHRVEDQRRHVALRHTVVKFALVVGIPAAFAPCFGLLGQSAIVSVGMGALVALAGLGVYLVKRDFDVAALKELDETIALLGEPDRR